MKRFARSISLPRGRSRICCSSSKSATASRTSTSPTIWRWPPNLQTISSNSPRAGSSVPDPRPRLLPIYKPGRNHCPLVPPQATLFLARKFPGLQTDGENWTAPASLTAPAGGSFALFVRAALRGPWKFLRRASLESPNFSQNRRLPRAAIRREPPASRALRALARLDRDGQSCLFALVSLRRRFLDFASRAQHAAAHHRGHAAGLVLCARVGHSRSAPSRH